MTSVLARFLRSKNARVQSTCAMLFRRVTQILTITAVLLWTNTSLSRAQNYILQPGDTILAEVVQVQGLAWTSMVDFSGDVRFPNLGRFKAAGRTLDELHEEIALASVGKQISFQNSESASSFFLDENSIFLGIASYRPVTVLGAVVAPSRIDFTPDLTVRSAIGAVGGVSVIQSPQEEPRLQRSTTLTARLNELRQTEAWLMMEAWHIKGQMDPEFMNRPPAKYAKVIDALMEPSDISDVRARIADAALEAKRAKVELADRVEISKKRIAFLEKSAGQYAVLSDAEEERLKAILTLKDRGLASSNVINDARAGAISASSRLLDTEAELSKARLETRTLLQQQESFDSDQSLDLMSEQAKVLQSLDEIDERIKGLQKELALLNGAQIITNETPIMTIRVIVHRKTPEGSKSLAVDLDDTVHPGDVLEVTFSFSS